eukprot:CAMPEP_0170366326 /NCGR_PEP_ID=MMETSP0117_2-20130122/6359_1 /TAXON_ID=400756 /ORGANISM="Durinskia baltica, Strain CSIRO CS-38" /LENGTH=41 /DNA_ID= /DNA_START= /DNA_END= /DNA_ORIENTATION=
MTVVIVQNGTIATALEAAEPESHLIRSIYFTVVDFNILLTA